MNLVVHWNLPENVKKTQNADHTQSIESETLGEAHRHQNLKNKFPAGSNIQPSLGSMVLGTATMMSHIEGPCPPGVPSLVEELDINPLNAQINTEI